MKRSTRFLFTVLGLTCASTVAFAQATSGDLVGTIKDASGAVIANARIQVTDEATGVTTVVTSGSTGEFRASNLLPDKYDLNVTAPGFQGYALRGVEVTLNKTATADIKLAIGTVTTIEVTADAGVTLDTTSTNLTTTFNNQELDVLPTATSGFGVLNASLLAPNVASPGGAGIGTGPSVGGQRPRNNNYTIEGIDDNDKSVTGPLLIVPNDAVGEFTLITSQFSPEFGHSSGGQFNTNMLSGTNHYHGRLYEYFDNRDLNAENAVAGGKTPNSRYDYNRYGGQFGGPILRDKLFFFGNFERQTLGQQANYFLCTPTAAGFATLNSLNNGFRPINLQEYTSLMPAATVDGGAQVTDQNDQACFDGSGPQTLTVTDLAGNPTAIPLGNAHLTPPTFTNTDQATFSVDFTPTEKNSFRFRYIYYTQGALDTVASLPAFYGTVPTREHLGAFSWFHTFTPNLSNEFRLGYNRLQTNTPVAGPAFPGLSAFPNLIIFDSGIDIGPDDNGPQSGIQNMYQVVNNVSWAKGKHLFKVGFDGRKYISPQNFIQRQRGDYEWNNLDSYLHDLAPDSSGERSAGAENYAGDQVALYGYANDTWRATPKLTLNYGLRYEFTSVPAGERKQSLNAISNVPGLITFNAPQPQYKNFAPRVGIAYAPDENTSIRAGFGVAYDVLFDNLGLLTSPPQLSQTHDVGNVVGGDPDYLSPNFLANGGLSNTLVPITDAATGKANTAAYLPNQVLPYSENYNLTVQHVFGKNYTAEIQYLGTRGIHLASQNQINVVPEVTAANQLTTFTTGPVIDASGTFATTPTSPAANTYAAITAQAGPSLYFDPAFYNAGFLSKMTSYQPYGGSNYNGLGLNLTRRLSHGLQTNISYTYSRAMDDSTAEVNASALTERRPQSSRNQHAEYARSALDRANRLTMEAVYDVPFFEHSSFLLRNLASGWQLSPIYTYESPEYVTATSNTNSNLNGDSGAISRTIINSAGNKSQGSGVVPVYSTTLAGVCTPPATRCNANLVGYQALNPGAYYIVAGKGTLPTAERNTLAGNPIDNVTMAAGKKITFTERYSFEFQVQAFNLLNHAQYVPGDIDGISSTATTTANTTLLSYLTAGKSNFNQPQTVYTAHARSLQLAAKFNF